MDKDNKKPLIIMGSIVAIFVLLTLLNPVVKDKLMDAISKHSFDIKPLWSLEVEQGSRVEGILDNIIIIKKGERLEARDSANSLLWSYPIPSDNSVVSVAIQKVYILDNQNNRITALNKSGNEEWSIAKEKVVDMRVLREDWLGVYIKEDSLTGWIEFIDAKGNLMGRIAVSDSILLDYDIDPVTHRIIISTMAVKNQDSFGLLSLSNLKGEAWWWNKDDDIVLKAFIGNDYILSRQSNRVTSTNYNRETLWSKEMGQGQMGVNNQGGYIYLYSSSSSKSTLTNTASTSTLELMAVGGEKIASVNVQEDNLEVKELDKYLVAYGKRKVYLFSEKGVELFNYSPKKDIINVYISKEKDIIIVYRNGISCYKLSN